MPFDYKYIDHDKAGRRGWRSLLFLLLILFLLGSIASYTTFYFQTRKVDELILTGQYQTAEEKLDHWTWLPLVNGRVYEKLGTEKLLNSGAKTASPYFQKSESKFAFRPMSIWQDVLKTLWTNGRYEDGIAYSTHLAKVLSQEDTVHFYSAGFLTGLNRLSEAEKELKNAGSIPELTKEISTLKQEISQRQTTGQYAILFDRENLPLANRSLKGETTILNENIAPFITHPVFGYLSTHKDSPAQAVLTIDYRVQNAAMNALGKYAGSIVILDVRSGDILAAASSQKGVNSEYPPDIFLPFVNQYEPGSIIKMITLSGALEHNEDFSKIFPFECKGLLELSQNTVLHDWKTHGEVKDINEATAVSCNVAFAKIGMAIKPADLIENLKQFGFNSKLDSTELPLELGKIADGDLGELYLSHLSIGLDALTMTPLHAALVASGIANHGTAMKPRLFSHNRNVIGLPFGDQPTAEFRKFMSPKTAEAITNAMMDVVRHPDGTGRRAAVDGLPFAMKTGTAGEGTTAYNAIIIGFAPVPDPKIAFSIVLEHAGKAEFEGARVTKLLLESIKGYI